MYGRLVLGVGTQVHRRHNPPKGHSELAIYTIRPWNWYCMRLNTFVSSLSLLILGKEAPSDRIVPVQTLFFEVLRAVSIWTHSDYSVHSTCTQQRNSHNSKSDKTKEKKKAPFLFLLYHSFSLLSSAALNSSSNTHLSSIYFQEPG